MALKFRNLDISPEEPVSRWGFEGLLAAVDRGSLGDWRKVMAEISRAPWGETAETLGQVLDAAEDSGVVEAMRRAVQIARDRAAAQERRVVAARLRALVAESGLSDAAFARRLGTSPSRLSTYLNGHVTPSAALMVRAEQVDAADEARR